VHIQLLMTTRDSHLTLDKAYVQHDQCDLNIGAAIASKPSSAANRIFSGSADPL